MSMIMIYINQEAIKALKTKSFQILSKEKNSFNARSIVRSFSTTPHVARHKLTNVGYCIDTATCTSTGGPIRYCNRPGILAWSVPKKQCYSFSSLFHSSSSSVQESRSFSALSPDIANKMRAEFELVDTNKDGKLDFKEFKQLLRRHKDVFTEAEILEISEMFYGATAGKSIPFEQVLQAINDTLTKTDAKKRKNETSRLGGSCAAEYYYDVNHHQWKKEDLNIPITHVSPKSISDKLAFNAAKVTRWVFDTITSWRNGEITQNKVLQRVIFLETIAAVPGMTAAIIRHFKSLRSMERDGGLINMFLEEATNERMHLLTFVTMRDPSMLFRASVIGAQFAFGSSFLLAYILSPNLCHRFVGYIEEEACSTYTKIIEAIEDAPPDSDLYPWKTQLAPKIGIAYWHLGESGTVLDLMYAVRADEAEHRDVNHAVVGMKPGDVNPRYDPSSRLELALNTYVRAIMTKSVNSTITTESKIDAFK